MAEDVLVRIRTALDQGGIDAARRELDELEAAARRTGGAYTDLGKKIAAGFAIAGAAAAAFVKKGIDLADQLNVVSERTGVSVEALSKLKFAADQSETSFETLTAGLQRLNIKIGKAGLSGEAAEVQPVLLALADKIKNTASAADQGDGRHRVAAQQGLGFKEIEAEVVPGATLAEAIRTAMPLLIHAKTVTQRFLPTASKATVIRGPWIGRGA